VNGLWDLLREADLGLTRDVVDDKRRRFGGGLWRGSMLGLWKEFKSFVFAVLCFALLVNAPRHSSSSRSDIRVHAS